MTTTTYKANSTNCHGYAGNATVLPTTVDVFATELTGTDLTNISTDDANFHQKTGTGTGSGHRIKIRVAESAGSITKITITTKGFAQINSGACLKKDSLIKIPNGEKRIDELKKGDLVLSYDIIKKEFLYNKVRAVQLRPIENCNNLFYQVITKDGDKINATFNHRFFVDDNYLQAEDLKVGMKLLRFDSKVTEIIAIQITPTVDTEVYDIEVEDNHNFFANGVLTHNRLVASYNQYLYAWNAASSTYGSVLASHANSTKTTLTYDITTNIANYIDANGDLNFICDSQFTGGSITSADNLYYAECVVTYTLSSGNFLELF